MKDNDRFENICQKNDLISSANIKQLCTYLLNKDRTLVFFVGAGISTTKNTGMPDSQTLIQQILLDGINYLKKSNTEITKISKLIDTIKDIDRVGFEITLNDFWQICPKATRLLYKYFSKLENRCTTNHVHAFLAYWLSTGGIVLTTNWDCFIEKEWRNINQNIKVRYQEKEPDSFKNWKKDLLTGGCLFKIHGSSEKPESCLGALEQVRTYLDGQRAELLTEVAQKRPLCFVGWSGIDPDIPPLLSDLYKKRSYSLPIFWIHYEGNSKTINAATSKVAPIIRKYASDNPILTEANRAFGEILHWTGIKTSPILSVTALKLDFSGILKHCTPSGIARFIGIVLRRTGKLDISGKVLNIAKKTYGTAEEYSAAIQEIALLHQQKNGQKTYQSIKLLEEANKALSDKTDIRLQLNINFGMLSMIIVGLRYRPWLILKLPYLFRKYRQKIKILYIETKDEKSFALHNSLLNLYLGRLRFKFFNWLAVMIPPLINWILQPFNTARLTIDSAEDIHIHTKIDVLSYRLVALAYFKRCKNLKEEINEINRLIKIFNDDARTTYWKKQYNIIKKRCSSN